MWVETNGGGKWVDEGVDSPSPKPKPKGDDKKPSTKETDKK